MKTFVLKFGLLCALVVVVGCDSQTNAQQTPQTPAPPKPQTAKKIETIADSPQLRQTEKSLETAAKPRISLCAAAQNISVRGWQRAEVRALVENRRVNFKIMERDADNKPAWIILQNAEAPTANRQFDECLRGESIEIEVPAGANVTVKSRDADVLIDGIAKVTIKNVNGDVTVRNVAEEIAVSNYSGNVAAEDSSGRIALASFDGNVAAFRLKPNEIGDQLSLSSAGGSVVLRDVQHKNIEAKSLSGEIAVLSRLQRGGNYEFSTQSGSVVLQLPADFGFQIKATMTAGGNFQTDFPVKPAAQTFAGQARTMTCTNGAADTTINLLTFNGFLRVKKK